MTLADTDPSAQPAPAPAPTPRRRGASRPTPDPGGGARGTRRTVPAALTRRGACVALAIAVLLTAGLFGLLRGATNGTTSAAVPPDAESARVAATAGRFPDAGVGTVVAVVTRTDGGALTQADLAGATSLATRLGTQVDRPVRPPVPSQDGHAAAVLVPLVTADTNSATGERIEALRAVARAAATPGTQVQITGGPAFGADIAGAFSGANVRLLLATIGIVGLLLLITYRSPILMLLPLAVVGTADQIAAALAARLGDRLGWQFDAGILSVLVFGAGANYALLLISRYREELRRTADHRVALATAWRGTAGAIVASNLTVVLALLTLGLAALPATRGLGLASAVGLVVALLAVLFVLPPLLAVIGRRAFWPFVPRAAAAGDAGPAAADDAVAAHPADSPTTGVFGRVARTVVRRPAVVLAASLALLAVLATGLFGTRVGLTQVEKFRVASESATGLTTLAEHFPAGESQPHVVVARADQAQAVTQAAAAVPGVIRASPVATAPATATDPGLVRISVVGSAAPDTTESFRVVEELRAATHAVPGADALVGGPTATEFDARATNAADLRLVAPLVIGVVLVVLAVLLRALVAPVLLALVNVASALAALGAGTYVGTHLFGFPGLDAQLPLLAFLFLVALGIDYTIFLAHRTRGEAATWGTREGTVRAVAATGGVITSAGLVLAGVFAALGVLPLVVLGQLGLIVGLGVLIDTLLVRTVVVPALFALVGDVIWWPGTARNNAARTSAVRTGTSRTSDGAAADGGTATVRE
ncbi:MAG: MMPL family transporter [Austwickia sp.]|jgi:RND superfamily putative drug exporter|nr:MAG: MMPL family transporter [Austwickia sp.]